MNSMSPLPTTRNVIAAYAAKPGGDDAPRRPITSRIKEAALRHMVASGERRTIKVSGNSMVPFLWDGDAVVIEPCGGAVSPGDIVVYFMGEVLVVHRIVSTARGRDGLVVRTKGDFSLSLDPAAVAESDLIGKAVALRRGGTHINLQSPLLRACYRVVAVLSNWVGLTLGKLRIGIRTP